MSASTSSTRTAEGTPTSSHTSPSPPALPSSLPSCIELSHSPSIGSHLRARSNLSGCSTLMREMPLAILPPLPPAIAQVNEWARKLGFVDEGILLYRGIFLYYLLYIIPKFAKAKQHAEAVSQRILSQYNPLEGEAGSAAREKSIRSAILQSLSHQSGLQSLTSLLFLVAEQTFKMFNVPPVPVEVLSTEEKKQHFLQKTIALAYIYNSNNMDLVFVPVHVGASSDDGSKDGASAGIVTESCTGIYDNISRLNHSCMSNAVHFLEDEEKYRENATKEQVEGIKQLVPSKLEELRSMRAAMAASSSAVVIPTPFIRTVRSLCEIAQDDEITISYLSPQYLCHSTSKRDGVLFKQWGFHCNCARCLSLDTARVLKCPRCRSGSVLFEPVLNAPATPGAPSEELLFTFASSCDCLLLAEENVRLLQNESEIEQAFTEFQSLLPSSRRPLELCLGLMDSIKSKHILSSDGLHWIWYEFGVILKDLYSLLNKPADALIWIKKNTWYLERVLQRTLYKKVEEFPQDFLYYIDSHYVIDVNNKDDYQPVWARVGRLYACAELRDAYETISEAYYKGFLALYPSSVPPAASASSISKQLRSLLHSSLYFNLCEYHVHECYTGESLLHSLASSSRVRAWHKRWKRILESAAQLKIDCAVFEKELMDAQTRLSAKQQLEQAQLKTQMAMKEIEGKQKQAPTNPASIAATPVTPAAGINSSTSASTTTTQSSSSPSATASPSSSSTVSLSCASSVCPSAATSSQIATLLCTRCRAVRYCSKECQKVDWKTHKNQCKPANA